MRAFAMKRDMKGHSLAYSPVNMAWFILFQGYHLVSVHQSKQEATQELNRILDYMEGK